MIKTENLCVDCGDGCRNCGLKHVEVEVCDNCECDGEELYTLNNERLCEDCAKEAIENNYDIEDLINIINAYENKNINTDINTNICEYCGKETKLYVFDDEIMCEDCAKIAIDDNYTIDELIDIIQTMT